MTAVRQDAWSPDDDLILAEVILRHIREGSTQLNAFEEVGERIGRTAAACGFRWNSCVRKKYETAIQMAKSQRQKRGKSRRRSDAALAGIALAEEEPAAKPDASSEESLSIDAVIRYLRQWKSTVHDTMRRIKTLEKENEERLDQVNSLQEENARLRGQLREVQSEFETVNEDYRSLIQIMDRARKLAFLQDAEDEEEKPRFKMDANGNLERID